MHKNHKINYTAANSRSRSERGAALATSLIVLSLLGAISMTVLAVVTHESRIAGSDLQRTQTFYAGAAAIEKMTGDFCALYARTSRPTQADYDAIAASYPAELVAEGFSFTKPDGSPNQTLGPDPNGVSGTVPIPPPSSFSGLIAQVTPFVLDTTVTQTATGTQVKLQRKVNNYLIPIFQFGMFSNEDLEVHPGPPFAFNGRVHANGNLYVSGAVTFRDKVTTANELVVDVLRNGSTHAQSMAVKVPSIATPIPLTMGSVIGGPNASGTSGTPGYFPDSPNGTFNSSWNSISKAPATGAANSFGGQVLTSGTGGVPLLLPMQLEGNVTREIVKRILPNDTLTLTQSRYHSKSQIRILVDDEAPVGADAAGIPAGQGVLLSTFDPIPLPNVAGGGRALWRINDNGTYVDTAATCVRQQNGALPAQALTVRGVKSVTQVNVTPLLSALAIPRIPAGAGLRGRILIQIVDANGNARDVTREILSMGMTEGEPNSIVMLQRPLWAAFTQGSRDATNSQNTAPDGVTKYYNFLTDIFNRTYLGADGEIKIAAGIPLQDATYGYLTQILDDTAAPPAQPVRSDTPPVLVPTAFVSAMWNSIVPINVYNVREGRINSGLAATTVYERGMTNVIEINMRNLARWFDGVYDGNLLANSPNARSVNIASPDGYTVYISDRRGDRVKPLGALNSTNGMVDNEDIYGPDAANGAQCSASQDQNGCERGEDVQGTGFLVKDTNELSDPAALPGAYGADIFKRALTASAWANLIGGLGPDKDNHKYFRNAVRLFNGENLQITGAAGRLSTTKGITISTENMVYIWGNYNTTGIDVAPPDGESCLNAPPAICRYQGNQVPTSIVADAFFPLSKTWFDSESSMFPDLLANRQADMNLPNVTAETSMRSAIIAGNNLSALSGNPNAGNGPSGEARLNGGMHNFPRFLESWSARWNFVGSLIPLYHSTQALGPYNADSTIYSPPTRDWAFDITFTDPNRLPPATPLFQHIEPTGFKQIL